MQCKNQHGFSLVELSIVLVILGLLVGGILAGQSLIRAGELRSVAVESDRIKTAMAAFRDKYQALPGDITNATSFWGIAGGTTGNDATCANASSTDARTCNGNGDGQILNYTGSYETFRIYQHLANAGLLEGVYSGTGASPMPGSNIPTTRLDAKAGWLMGYNGNVSGSANAFNGFFGNGMNLFAWYGASPRSIMTPSEAWNIDKKLDDGGPGTGVVISNWSAGYSAAGIPCTNASSGADVATTYNLASTTKDCGLFFIRL